MIHELACTTGKLPSSRMRTKSLLISLAFFFVLLATLVTGLGGWADITGKPILLTREHAWNDGIFAVLVAIFLVLVLPHV
jgi:hypothetical protein